MYTANSETERNTLCPVAYLDEILSKISRNSRKTVFRQRAKKSGNTAGLILTNSFRVTFNPALGCGPRSPFLICKITAASLTDHCMVTLYLGVLKKRNISPNIWKFNNNLLKNDIDFTKKCWLLLRRLIS